MVAVSITYICSPETSFEDDIELRVATIGDVKSYIDEYHGIPRDEQILVYDNKLMLNDNKRLAELGRRTPKRMTLFHKISRQEIQVTIVSEWFHDDLVLNVPSNGTVLSLKEAIDQRKGLPPYRQRLSTGGYELEDGDALHEYTVSTEPTFYLEVTPEVFTDRIQVNVASYSAETGLVERTFDVARSETPHTLFHMAREAGLADGRSFVFVTTEGQTLYGAESFEELGINTGDWLSLSFELDG